MILFHFLFLSFDGGMNIRAVYALSASRRCEDIIKASHSISDIHIFIEVNCYVAVFTVICPHVMS